MLTKIVVFGLLMIHAYIHTMDEAKSIPVCQILYYQARKALEQGDEVRARELFSKHTRYQSFQSDAVEYQKLVQAVMNKDKEVEKNLVFLLMEKSGNL